MEALGFQGVVVVVVLGAEGRSELESALAWWGGRVGSSGISGCGGGSYPKGKGRSYISIKVKHQHQSNHTDCRIGWVGLPDEARLVQFCTSTHSRGASRTTNPRGLFFV